MPAAIIHSNEIIQKVKELFDGGMLLRPIARKLNMPRHHIKRIFKILNISTGGRKNPKILINRLDYICKICSISKPINEYRAENDKRNNRIAYRTICKICEVSERKKKYNLNIEEEREYANNYNKQNRVKINKKDREKYYNDPNYRLRKRVSCDIKKSLFKEGRSCLDYLPYTIKELRAHIEKTFSNKENLHNGNVWMTWENWGKYEIENWDDNKPNTFKWSLDHIIPQSDLIYNSYEHENFKKCWALENLRAYSAKSNLIDGTQRIRHQNKMDNT